MAIFAVNTMTFYIVSDIVSGILSVLYSDFFYLTLDILSGILSDIYSDMLSDSLFGI